MYKNFSHSPRPRLKIAPMAGPNSNIVPYTRTAISTPNPGNKSLRHRRRRRRRVDSEVVRQLENAPPSWSKTPWSAGRAYARSPVTDRFDDGRYMTP